MKDLTPPARPPANVLCQYLLNELRPITSLKFCTGNGMPADTILVEPQNLIVSFTCVAAPMFRSKSYALAERQALDVALVRCCVTSLDVLPMFLDVVLAGGGLAPFVLNDLSVYRHRNGALWAVPEGFGAALRFTVDGLELQMVPPYPTLAARADGIYAAASEMAALLYPQRVS